MKNGKRIGYSGTELSPETGGLELPEGMTCGDCGHIRRCLAIGYTGSRERTGCDFDPIRFVPSSDHSAGTGKAKP